LELSVIKFGDLSYLANSIQAGQDQAARINKLAWFYTGGKSLSILG
jgi:hypothetical protein